MRCPVAWMHCWAKCQKKCHLLVPWRVNRLFQEKWTRIKSQSQMVALYSQDFIKDPIGIVRRAYEHFDLDLSDQAESAMQSFVDDNPADKHGQHFYSFADTGMDEQKVRELFHDYQSYFDIPRETV